MKLLAAYGDRLLQNALFFDNKNTVFPQRDMYVRNNKIRHNYRIVGRLLRSGLFVTRAVVLNSCTVLLLMVDANKKSLSSVIVNRGQPTCNGG